jgi:hypothetical protein
MPERFYDRKPPIIPDLENRITPREESFLIPLEHFRENYVEKEPRLNYRENLNAIISTQRFEERLNRINIIQQREPVFRRERNESLLLPENDSRDRLGITLRQFAGLYPTVPDVIIPRTLDQRQVNRIGDAVDGLAIVRGAFSDIPEDELTALLGKVEGSLSDSTGQDRAKLVSALFNSSESSGFTSGVRRAGLNLAQLPELILDEGMFSLVSAMLAHPDKYRMQLGIILSQVNLDQIPEELKERLKPHMSGLEFSVETSHGSWYLCSAAEPRLAKSVEESAVMAIGEEDNPYFLVKFRGKLSGLCLQDVTTSDGKVFVRGIWYSPTDRTTRDALRDAFDAGKGKVDLQKGNWALMRPIRPKGNAEQLVNDALRVARNTPDVYPSTEIVVDGIPMQRQDYRERYKEED